jgi:hypothetical protein
VRLDDVPSVAALAPDVERVTLDDFPCIGWVVGGFLCRFVVLDDHQFAAVTLWILHTWTIEAAETTPYLAITSPEKRAGKTRLLELLQLLARNAYLMSSTSEAALFRLIDEEQATVLFDETDAMFSVKAKAEYEAIRGLINSGYRRSGATYRVSGVGAAMKAERFSTFGAKALAGIGELPDTITDRSLPIRMHRRTREEPVERFRERLARPEAELLRARLEAWADLHVDELRDAYPALPEELDDRGQDAAEPLLAIADLLGGDWPALARTAVVKLRQALEPGDDSYGVQLLGDTHRIFDEIDAEQVTTASLVEALCADEEAPWGDWHGKPITSRQLARLLRPFGIRSRDLWTDAGSKKGYRRADFTAAWARYAPQSAITARTA